MCVAVTFPAEQGHNPVIVLGLELTEKVNRTFRVHTTRFLTFHWSRTTFFGILCDASAARNAQDQDQISRALDVR